MTALDQVIERTGAVDTARMGIGGGSYGGFMTNWAIGHTNRFAAAVSMRSISNLVSEYSQHDIVLWGELELGPPPWPDQEALWERSPIKYVREMKTPLLLTCGEMDLRCAISQSEELFGAMRLLGQTAELVRFPEESHDISRSGRPDRRVERLRRIAGWFERFLGTHTAERPAGVAATVPPAPVEEERPVQEPVAEPEPELEPEPVAQAAAEPEPEPLELPAPTADEAAESEPVVVAEAPAPEPELGACPRARAGRGGGTRGRCRHAGGHDSAGGTAAAARRGDDARRVSGRGRAVRADRAVPSPRPLLRSRPGARRRCPSRRRSLQPAGGARRRSGADMAGAARGAWLDLGPGTRGRRADLDLGCARLPPRRLRSRPPLPPQQPSSGSTIVAWPGSSAPAAAPPEPAFDGSGSEAATSIMPAWSPPQANATKETLALHALQPEPSAQGEPPAKLTFETGPFARRVVGIPDSSATIGRAPDNDIIIGDPATSGRHCRIEVRAGAYWISDLGSTNGTLVNGEPIIDKQIDHGDVISDRPEHDPLHPPVVAARAVHSAAASRSLAVKSSTSGTRPGSAVSPK